MSKFWQKKYISKYTGAEIDAAVAKADTVPAVTEADAGKALVVDAEGKIVAGQVSGGVIDGDYKPTGASYSFSEILPRIVATIIAAGETSGYLPVNAQYYGSELNNYIINEAKAGKTHIAGTATGTLPSGTITIPYDCEITYKSVSEEFTLISFNAFVNIVLYQFNITFGITSGNSISMGCFYQFNTVS